jgi:RNA polymerase sigma-70 factor (ECF subfamily)
MESALDHEWLAVEDRMLAGSWEREHDEHILRQLMNLVEPEFTATTWAAFRGQVSGQISPVQVARELGITVNAALIAKSRVLRRLRQEAAGLVD